MVERTAVGSAKDVSVGPALPAARWAETASCGRRPGNGFRRRGAAPTLMSSVGHVKSLDRSVGIQVTPSFPTHAPITPLPAPAKQICPSDGSPPFSRGSCNLIKSEYEEKTTPLIWYRHISKSGSPSICVGKQSEKSTDESDPGL